MEWIQANPPRKIKANSSTEIKANSWNGFRPPPSQPPSPERLRPTLQLKIKANSWNKGSAENLHELTWRRLFSFQLILVLICRVYKLTTIILAWLKKMKRTSQVFKTRTPKVLRLNRLTFHWAFQFSWFVLRIKCLHLSTPNYRNWITVPNVSPVDLYIILHSHMSNNILIFPHTHTQKTKELCKPYLQKDYNYILHGKLTSKFKMVYIISNFIFVWLWLFSVSQCTVL